MGRKGEREGLSEGVVFEVAELWHSRGAGRALPACLGVDIPQLQRDHLCLAPGQVLPADL